MTNVNCSPFLDDIGSKKSNQHYNSDSEDDEQDQDNDLDVGDQKIHDKNGKEDGGESELSELEEEEDGMSLFSFRPFHC